MNHETMKFPVILCCCLIAIIAEERTSFVDSLPSGSFYKRDLPDEHLILEPEVTGFGSFEDSFEVTAYDEMSGRIRIRRQEVEEDGDDDDADGDGNVVVVLKYGMVIISKSQTKIIKDFCNKKLLLK